MLQTLPSKKNDEINFYTHLAIHRVEDELYLLEKKLINPEYFSECYSKALSPLHLSSDIKPINIMEVITALYDRRVIVDASGNPITFTQLVRSFEELFNINFNGRERKIKGELYNRKRGETKFLDSLRNTILERNNNNLPSR